MWGGEKKEGRHGTSDRSDPRSRPKPGVGSTPNRPSDAVAAGIARDRVKLRWIWANGFGRAKKKPIKPAQCLRSFQISPQAPQGPMPAFAGASAAPGARSWRRLVLTVRGGLAGQSRRSPLGPSDPTRVLSFPPRMNSTWPDRSAQLRRLETEFRGLLHFLSLDVVAACAAAHGAGPALARHFLSIAFVRGAGQSSPCASNQFEQRSTWSGRGARRGGPTQDRARAPAGGAARSALRPSPHIHSCLFFPPHFFLHAHRHDARQKPAKRRLGALPAQSSASPAQSDPPFEHCGKDPAPDGCRKKKIWRAQIVGVDGGWAKGSARIAQGRSFQSRFIRFKVGLFASRSVARLDGNDPILSNLVLTRHFGFARARGPAPL